MLQTMDIGITFSHGPAAGTGANAEISGFIAPNQNINDLATRTVDLNAALPISGTVGASADVSFNASEFLYSSTNGGDPFFGDIQNYMIGNFEAYSAPTSYGGGLSIGAGFYSSWSSTNSLNFGDIPTGLDCK